MAKGFGRERTRFVFVGCDCEPECVVQYVIDGAPRDSDALAEPVPDWVLAYVAGRHPGKITQVAQ